MRDVVRLLGKALHDVEVGFSDEEFLDYGAEGEELEGCWGGHVGLLLDGFLLCFVVFCSGMDAG